MTTTSVPTYPSPRNLSGITKARLEAFSDGVLAIVITLLAIELRPPEVEPGHTLANARSGRSGRATSPTCWPSPRSG